MQERVMIFIADFTTLPATLAIVNSEVILAKLGFLDEIPFTRYR